MMKSNRNDYHIGTNSNAVTVVRVSSENHFTVNGLKSLVNLNPLRLAVLIPSKILTLSTTRALPSQQQLSLWQQRIAELVRKTTTDL